MKEVLSFLSSLGYHLVWSERCKAYLVYNRDSYPLTYLPYTITSFFRDFECDYGVGYDSLSGCLYVKIF